MFKILQLFTNRNFILILSVVLGLTIGDYSHYFKDYTLIVLAIVMAFSTTGLRIKALRPLRKVIKPMVFSIFLNYVLLSGIILFLAWWLAPSGELFMGFVVIAATPPGVAVIPFSQMLKGNVNYAIIGVFGAYLLSVAFTPFVISVFSTAETISSTQILLIMLKVIVIPILLSRVLLWKRIYKTVETIRGQVVNWGFAIIIFTAVGVNRRVFFTDLNTVFISFTILIISMFVIGTFIEFIMLKTHRNRPLATTQTLMYGIKSSGFAATTSLLLFGEKTAMPSAVLSIAVILFLLYLSFKHHITKKQAL